MTEDTYRGETAKPETGHLYAYCANNPVNYVDPSGHKAKTVIYFLKKGKDFKKQAMHSPYYKNSQVTFKSVIKKAQFKKEWDKIPKGTSELYLYLHGGVSCLYFDGSDMNLKELLALKKKKIKKKIVLLSCKGASCIIKMWMLKIENTSEYNKTTDWQVSKNLIEQRGIYNEV